MRVLAITFDRYHYIKPLEKYLNCKIKFCDKTNISILDTYSPQIVLFLADWDYDLYVFSKACKTRNIPSVLLMDGLIEWQHFFENPKWSFGGNEAPYFPVYCDKIFVPGASTYRFLTFWGNEGKCEVTGLPRLDEYQNRENYPNYITDGKQIIGVMSANTAGYTPDQIEQSKKLFGDIYGWSQSNPKIKIKWRIRKDFHQLFDFDIENNNSGSLEEYFADLNGVICQPSTVVYEAMLRCIPVALVDYSLAPNYMHSPWEIRCKAHIPSVVSELLKPSAIKMKLQTHLLNDNLMYIGHSARIAAETIKSMISHANNLKEDEWEFPKNIANDIARVVIPNHENLFIDELFPNRGYSFSEKYLLEEELIKVKIRNEELVSKIKINTVSYWLSRIFQKFYKSII